MVRHAERTALIERFSSLSHHVIKPPALWLLDKPLCLLSHSCPDMARLVCRCHYLLCPLRINIHKPAKATKWSSIIDRPWLHCSQAPLILHTFDGALCKLGLWDKQKPGIETLLWHYHSINNTLSHVSFIPSQSEVFAEINKSQNHSGVIFHLLHRNALTSVRWFSSLHSSEGEAHLCATFLPAHTDRVSTCSAEVMRAPVTGPHSS